MRVEVINTGTELLLGSVVNTHLRLLSDALFPLGLRIQRQVTVPDGDAIRTAIAETLGRADIVFITGGLGPTTDDITREAVAEWLGLEMIRDESVVRAIEARFARRQLTMSPRNVRQAPVVHRDNHEGGLDGKRSAGKVDERGARAIGVDFVRAVRRHELYAQTRRSGR